jgi:hypothetical protein
MEGKINAVIQRAIDSMSVLLRAHPCLIDRYHRLVIEPTQQAKEE